MIATWFAACCLSVGPADGPELPVVVLVGDSIRLGYGPIVAERLRGRARVVGSPENAGDSRNVLAHLDEWAIRDRPAVVHFNAGLHDIKLDPASGSHQVELPEYRDNLRAILRRLGAATDARLVFATTTPVVESRRERGKRPEFLLRNADVDAYNRAAREVAADSPIARVDDLHALVERVGPGAALGPDGVHFLEAASRALAEGVVASVEAALAEVEATREATCRRASRPPTLDGKLDDAAWAASTAIDRFPSAWSQTPSDGRTTARLLWDDDYLYFGATMLDDSVRAAGVRRNDRLWLGDVFELFIRPDGAKPAYYEFQVNPRSVPLELAIPGRGADFARLAEGPSLGLEAVALVDGTVDRPGDLDRGWTVEGRVPWSAFAPTGGRPNPGDAWRFALCRYDYGAEGARPTLTSSAPLRRPGFHRSEEYGRLIFGR